MEYTNPFSANNPSDFSEGATPWQMFYGAKKEAESMPFLQQSALQQLMQSAGERQKLQESMSPEAVMARKTGLQADTAKNQGVIDQTPWETKKKLDDVQAQLALSPHLTKQKIAEAKQAALHAENTPYRDLISQIGQVGEHYDQIPKEMRKTYYEGIVRQWQEQHPGLNIPESLKLHSEDPKEMERIFHTAAYTDLEGQKLKNAREVARIQGEYSVKGHQISAGATTGAARIAADASIANEESRSGSKEERAAQQRKDSIQKHVSEILKSDLDYYLDKPEVKKQKYEAAVENAIKLDERLNGNRIDKPPVPVGRVQVKDKNGKIGTIPRNQLEAAKLQGYSEVHP